MLLFHKQSLQYFKHNGFGSFNKTATQGNMYQAGIGIARPYYYNVLYQHRVDENSGIHAYTHSICLFERFVEIEICYSTELEEEN